MIKETLDSIRRVTMERISSPILGAFAFFWFVCNWSIILIILKSNLPVEKTVDDIICIRETWISCLIYPLAFTFIFLLIYPWINYLTTCYLDFVELKRNKSRTVFECEILMAKRELFLKEAELEEIKIKRKQELDKERIMFEHKIEMESQDKDMDKEIYKMDKEMRLKELRIQKQKALIEKYGSYAKEKI